MGTTKGQMFINFVVPRVTYLECSSTVVHLQLLIMSKLHEMFHYPVVISNQLIYLILTVCQWLWPWYYNIAYFILSQTRLWFVAKCLRAWGIGSTPRLLAKWFRPLPHSQTNSKIPPTAIYIFCYTNVFTMMHYR